MIVERIWELWEVKSLRFNKASFSHSALSLPKDNRCTTTPGFYRALLKKYAFLAVGKTIESGSEGSWKTVNGVLIRKRHFVKSGLGKGSRLDTTQLQWHITFPGLAAGRYEIEDTLFLCAAPTCKK